MEWNVEYVNFEYSLRTIMQCVLDRQDMCEQGEKPLHCASCAGDGGMSRGAALSMVNNKCLKAGISTTNTT